MSIETGLNKYEIGIYDRERLIEVFRTDTDFALPVIRSEAEKEAERLRKENPQRTYSVKEI